MSIFQDFGQGLLKSVGVGSTAEAPGILGQIAGKNLLLAIKNNQVVQSQNPQAIPVAGATQSTPAAVSSINQVITKYSVWIVGGLLALVAIKVARGK